LTLIPATDKSYLAKDDANIRAVGMTFNSLIGIGLVESGFREEAAQLFQNLMLAVVDALKQDHRFFASYHADEGNGLGSLGDFQGLLPLDLFLAILGVRFITPTKVWVQPGHPFPWPIRVDWQGLSLHCERDVVHIQFPDGQEVSVEGGEGRFVEQLATSVETSSDQEE
jgi:hypothetical protein